MLEFYTLTVLHTVLILVSSARGYMQGKNKQFNNTQSKPFFKEK